MASNKRRNRFKDTERLAHYIRLNTLNMIYGGKGSHLASNLSIADILAVLYANILRVDPKRPKWPARDRFILSKGHACASLYAALAACGFFSEKRLATYYKDGSTLLGHVTSFGIPGVEVSTGSLGHGLPIACGMALAGKADGKRYRVFALLSDGECDEGSNWEAMMFAGHNRLDNLVSIVDYNKLQACGSTKAVLDLEPLADKIRSFGWSVKEVDGHDHGRLKKALSSAPFKKGKPSCIIAHTLKGKGIRFMEKKVLWHYRCPDDGEMCEALGELGESK